MTGATHQRPNWLDRHESLLFSPVTPYSLGAGTGSGLITITLETISTLATTSDTAGFGYRIDGEVYVVESDADTTSPIIADAFDLSGESDLSSGEYQKVILQVDDAGAFDYKMGDVLGRDAAPMPDPDEDKAVIGWLDVTGPNDWDGEDITASATLHEENPHAK